MGVCGVGGQVLHVPSEADTDRVPVLQGARQRSNRCRGVQFLQEGMGRRMAEGCQGVGVRDQFVGNKAFGGYCSNCERPMFKKNVHRSERIGGWVQRENAMYCGKCYRSQIIKPQTSTPMMLLAAAAGVQIERSSRPGRPLGLDRCSVCWCPMRNRTDPPEAGVRIRQTTELCNACYIRQRKLGVR